MSKKYHKFVIQVPKKVDEEYKTYQQTGNTFWIKSIENEMANFRVVFEVLKGVTQEQMIEGKVKPVFKYVGTHIIFYIKMDVKFTPKSRIVAGGHNMEPP